MNKLLVSLALLFSLSVLANGQYIATNAKIIKVGNTAGNGESFSVVATQGEGPCISSGSQINIYFPLYAAGSEKVYDRAYAMALAALASGKKVNIYNYAGASCDTAAGIEIMADQ